MYMLLMTELYQINMSKITLKLKEIKLMLLTLQIVGSRESELAALNFSRHAPAEKLQIGLIRSIPAIKFHRKTNSTELRIRY